MNRTKFSVDGIGEEVKNGTICIVASTMPSDFIATKLNDLNIIRLVAMTRNLEASFKTFESRSTNVRVSKPPSGTLIQLFYFVGLLSMAKLKGQRVAFFHECSMPIFDLAVKFLNPKGYFLPQVTLSGWEEIRFEDYGGSRKAALLRLLGLHSLFRYYRSRTLNGQERVYAAAFREYPRNIVSFPPESFASPVLSEISLREESKKILFLAGKTNVTNESQIGIYKDIAEMATALGFKCYVKDHPNPDFRIGLQDHRVEEIDPTVPAELLDKDYAWAVGVSSHSLLAFGNRAVSFLNMLTEMSAENRAFCKAHYDTSRPDNGINYIDSVTDFRSLLQAVSVPSHGHKPG